jgi:hypothetical protein
VTRPRSPGSACGSQRLVLDHRRGEQALEIAEIERAIGLRELKAAVESNEKIEAPAEAQRNDKLHEQISWLQKTRDGAVALRSFGDPVPDTGQQMMRSSACSVITGSTGSVATGALVDHAFGVWKLNRVEIRAGVENKRSRAIPERLGFTQEGVLRQAERVGDRFVDHVMYSILADEWKARQT